MQFAWGIENGYSNDQTLSLTVPDSFASTTFGESIREALAEELRRDLAQARRYRDMQPKA